MFFCRNYFLRNAVVLLFVGFDAALGVGAIEKVDGFGFVCFHYLKFGILCIISLMIIRIMNA